VQQRRGNGGPSRPGAGRARRAGRDPSAPIGNNPSAPIGNNLGALIGDSRRAAGLTQRELADLADVGLGTVRDIEQGRTPRPRSLARLAGALGLDVTRGPARPGGYRWLRVLGPLEAWRGGAPVELGPPRQRAVLGLLAVSPDEQVRRETIIDALWDEPPATAVNLVQSYVSRLRRLLDPSRPARDRAGLLVSTGTSYRLQATPGELDLVAFRQVVDRARAARAAGSAAAACDLYDEALRLWRGDPLADVDLLRDHLAVADLAGRYAAVVGEYAETAFAAGFHERVLPRVEALARTEPLNERAHAQLMIALASTGRQAAALMVYQDLRHRLDEELGIRPGPELTDAHLRVLRQELPLLTRAR
jgi:DNA-binding SARP family transcriptional activator/DNA-binding XRE family transcriptional regulator